MGHMLEIVNGEASYAGRQPAWHKLGTVMDDLTFDDAMDKANLSGWNVRAEPLVVSVDGEDYPLDGQTIVRNNPATGKVEPMGTVGGRYTTVQNEQALGVASFLEDLGATVETAGSLRLGRQVFMSMSLGKGFVIDPDGAGDRVQEYLLLTTSHDGSLAIEASATPVRVVCANTLDMALPQAVRSYKIRHTATAAERLAIAQGALATANGYFDTLADEAAALYQTDVTKGEFFDIVSSVYPKPGSPESGVKESKRGLTVWEKKVDSVTSLFGGQTNANIAGTAWAAMNAMTERLDWHRTARGGDGSSLAIAASGINSPVAGEKNLIRDTVVSFAREKNPSVFA